MRNPFVPLTQALLVLSAATVPLAAEDAPDAPDIEQLAVIAPGWQGQILARVDQSYLGCDIAVGDADNDGRNEIVLATGKGDRTQPGMSYLVLVKESERSGRGHEE